MSLKDLFKQPEGYRSKQSLQEAGEEVESADYLEQATTGVARYLPEVDYEDPSSFARYGLAEHYYSGAIRHIYSNYPYDGSAREREQWRNRSTDLDLWIFDNRYPRFNGHALLSSDGYGTINTITGSYQEPSEKEYIFFKGGPHSGTLYNEADFRTSNLRFGGSEGNTVEFWFKKDDVDDPEYNEVLVDVWSSGTAYDDGDWGRFTIGLGPAQSLRRTIGPLGSGSAHIFPLTKDSRDVVGSASGSFIGTNISFVEESIVAASASMQLDATTDYLNIPASEIDIGTTPPDSWWALAFGRVEDVGGGGITANIGLFGQGDTSGDNHFGVFTVSNVVRARFFDNTATGVDAATPSLATLKTDGEWRLFAAKVDRDNDELSIHVLDPDGYHNGVSSIAGLGNFNPTAGWQIGNDVTVNSWEGQIGYHAIGSGTLSSASILSLYSQSLEIPTEEWLCTYRSGTDGVAEAEVEDATIIDDLWHHHALTFESATSGEVRIKHYVDGELDSTALTGTAIGPVSGSLIGTVGSLVHSPSGSTYDDVEMLGWGKMSGAIDEFRFWKRARTGADIGKYWFSNVYGGANHDDSNVDLGVYYKFNEGITLTSSTDNTVLDYSGRLSNGTWTGYDSGHRSTASAMVVSGKADREFKDPTIYSNHPDVVMLNEDLGGVGKVYDQTNPASMYYSTPDWILSEDGEDETYLYRQLTQIIAAYMDQLHVTIESLPDLHDTSYVSASSTPPSFMSSMLRSNGMEAPQLFVDSDVIEAFDGRSSNIIFEKKLDEIRNLIYKNLYNNLIYILKSKGTMKSIRNALRCIGIDEDLVAPNLYADGVEYTFENDSRRPRGRIRNFVNFFNPDNFDATVYQDNIDDGVAFLTGTPGDTQGFTIEGYVQFPAKIDFSSENYFDIPFVTSSLFGFYECLPFNDPSFSGSSPTFLRCVALRQERESKHARFAITGSDGTELTTSVYYNVYDNTDWTFAVKLKPRSYPWNSYASGASTEYDIEFQGVQSDAGITYNSFLLTASVSNIGDVNKRVFCGAIRNNFTGSTTIVQSDVKIGALRAWQSFITSSVIEEHAKDISLYGSELPVRSALSLRESFGAPYEESLALNWEFHGLTASTDIGFEVGDVSSGSVERYGEFSGSFRGLCNGSGNFFYSNASASFDQVSVASYERNLPEVLGGSDTISLIDSDSEIFTRETKPRKMFLFFEKSMNQVISRTMMNMLGSMAGMDDMIGQPVHRFRDKYKTLQLARHLFFEDAGQEPDFIRFTEFYRWIDRSVSAILRQLLPISLSGDETVRNVIESHILERNKTRAKYPNIKERVVNLETPIKGRGLFKHPWQTGHHPVSGDENENCYYWKKQYEKGGDQATIDEAVERDVSGTENSPMFMTVKKSDTMGGGYNADTAKRELYRSLYPGESSKVYKVSSTDLVWDHCKDDEDLP